jgi:hypothetical protein
VVAKKAIKLKRAAKAARTTSAEAVRVATLAIPGVLKKDGNICLKNWIGS